MFVGVVGSSPILFLVLFVTLAVAATATGQEWNTFTQEELRALPRVCHAQRIINMMLDRPLVPEAERAEWAARLGEKDYKTFHHYCWALIFLRRGHEAQTELQRTNDFKYAVENFVFVQRNASPQFPLMPEVNLQKGLALRLLKDDPAAAREFTNALRLKPDYTPAYAALVDLLLDGGDEEGARQILATGIERVPDSKILARKKAEIESRSASRE